MSELFRIPSDRQPWLIEGTPYISRVWYLFLQGMFVRQGASTGPSVPDLEFGTSSGASADQNAVFMQQIQSLGVSPEVQQLRDEIAELRKVVEGIQAGVVI